MYGGLLIALLARLKPATPRVTQVGQMASITYYGRLGEMGASEDRADPVEWGPPDLGADE